MIKRIITALLLLPIAISLLILPYPWLVCATFALVSALMAWEILNFFGEKITFTSRVLTLLSVAFIYLLKYLYFFTDIRPSNLYLSMSAAFFMLTFIHGSIYVFRSKLDDALINLTASLLSTLYAGLFLSFAIDLRFFDVHLILFFESDYVRELARHPQVAFLGSMYLIYAFVVCWLYDSGAYFFGKFFGKKSIGINSSPNKTWAGVWGGLASSFLGYFLFIFICQLLLPALYPLSIFHRHPILMAFLSVVFAAFGQMGDLIESVMKRSAGVKDSGTLLAGHGGAFDRLDSQVPVIFVIFFFLNYYEVLFR